MTLKVVGAGLGRTGTHSLKEGLERLLGGTCYHMLELFPRPQQIPVWHAAMRGEAVDWDALLGEFVAIVDWPGAAVWPQILEANPGAVVVLSVRDSAEAWWASFSQTILAVMERDLEPPGLDGWTAMATDMLNLLTADWRDQHGAMAAYDAHNQRVRDLVPHDRLVEWRPSDGWGPLCAGLGVAVPADPFPHTNTTDEFRLMAGLNG